MSSVFIVGLIVLILIILVSYAFIYQTMENKKKQRTRLIAALKQRVNNFKYMISGFPKDFLTKELTVLIYRCLIDVTEQLAKLDSKNDGVIEELNLYQSLLVEAQASSVSAKRIHLENAGQIKEVRNHLQELLKFIEKLQTKGTVTVNQATVYRRQIEKLVLQISVDAYLSHAKQAQQADKTRLAAHYYTLARKLLVRGNSQNAYSKQIEQIDGVIKRLEEKLLSETPAAQSGKPGAEGSSEWAEFNKEEEGWKKKNVYD